MELKTPEEIKATKENLKEVLVKEVTQTKEDFKVKFEEIKKSMAALPNHLELLDKMEDSLYKSLDIIKESVFINLDSIAHLYNFIFKSKDYFPEMESRVKGLEKTFDDLVPAGRKDIEYSIELTEKSLEMIMQSKND